MLRSVIFLRIRLVGRLGSERVENEEEIEKWKERRDLVFSHMYLVGKMKKWRDEKFICLVEKKNERIENETKK